jgi:hypothetical protein
MTPKQKAAAQAVLKIDDLAEGRDRYAKWVLATDIKSSRLSAIVSGHARPTESEVKALAAVAGVTATKVVAALRKCVERAWDRLGHEAREW